MTAVATNAPKSGAFRRWTVPLIVAIAFFMEMFDTAALIVAMPQIATELRVATLHLSLLVSVYVLSVVLFMPVSGWLATRFGARRMFTGALAVYAVGSVGCMMAPDLGWLLAFRVLQGMGGALMTPIGRLIMLRSFAPHELIAAMGLMTAPVLFGPLLGPLVGGFISTHFGWRWIFAINVPLAGLALMAALIFVPRDKASDGPHAPFDLRGFLLLSPALALFQIFVVLLGRSGGDGFQPFVALTASMAFAIAYRWHAKRRGATALIHLGLFAIPSFRTGSLTGAISRMGFNAIPFLLPLYLQIVLGLSPTVAGALVASAIGGSLIAKPFNGWLVRCLGFRMTLAGSALIGAGLIVGLILQPQTAHPAVLCLHIFVIGAVQTIQYNTLNILTYTDVEAVWQSNASSLGGLIHQIAMGLAVSWSAAALSLASHGAAPGREDFLLVFGLAGLLPLSAGVFYLRQNADR